MCNIYFRCDINTLFYTILIIYDIYVLFFYVIFIKSSDFLEVTPSQPGCHSWFGSRNASWCSRRFREPFVFWHGSRAACGIMQIARQLNCHSKCQILRWVQFGTCQRQPVFEGSPAVISEAVRAGNGGKKSKLCVPRLNKCQFPGFLLAIRRHSSG